MFPRRVSAQRPRVASPVQIEHRRSPALDPVVHHEQSQLRLPAVENGEPLGPGPLGRRDLAEQTRPSGVGIATRNVVAAVPLERLAGLDPTGDRSRNAEQPIASGRQRPDASAPEVEKAQLLNLLTSQQRLLEAGQSHNRKGVWKTLRSWWVGE